MLKHILSNLSHRPTRTAVSTLAVSVGVVLILVSVGLIYGQLNDNAERTRMIGGDVMIQPPDASLIFALNSGTLPQKLQGIIEEVDGVQAVTPILAKFISERFHIVFGIDKKTFFRVNRSLHFLEGRIFESPDEVVVDSLYSVSQKVKVGDRLELLGRNFVISGIYEQGTASRVLMSLEVLQEMNGTPEKVTMFFARFNEAAGVDTVFERLKRRMPHYKITKTSELQEIMAASTPVFKQFLTAILILAVVISFLIILLAMYSTIVERTREIGILKSLGASKSYIIQLILQESLTICLMGVGLGFALSYLAIRLVLAFFPSMPVSIPPFWAVAAALMAIGGGLLGALYPAFKAAQLDPVRALGYE